MLQLLTPLVDRKVLEVLHLDIFLDSFPFVLFPGDAGNGIISRVVLEYLNGGPRSLIFCFTSLVTAPYTPYPCQPPVIV